MKKQHLSGLAEDSVVTNILRQRSTNICPPTPAPNSLFLPILELPPSGCKFPVGNDKHRHLFCGTARVELFPYCDFHCRIAYWKYGQ